MSKTALLSYTKDFNRKSDSKRPKTTVTGNVALILDDDLVDRFNIPVLEEFLPIVKVKGSSYINRFGKQVTLPEYERIHPYLRQTLSARVHYQGQRYLFKFPWFFNFSMVRQGLYALLQYSNKLDDLYFTYRKRKRKYWIDNEPSAWGKVTLGKLPLRSNNIEKTSITGELTLIYNSTPKKPKLRDLLSL